MEHKNGCYNRPALRTERIVQDGWTLSGWDWKPIRIRIADPMTKDCQYTKTELGKVDKGCEGCAWKEYVVPISVEIV